METDQFRFLIRTADFDSSLRFYQDLLGLRLAESWDRSDSRGAVLSLGGNSVVVLLGAAPGETYRFPPPDAIYVGMEVDGVDAWHERLREAKVELLDDPEDKPWGLRSFHMRDPNGVELYMFSRLER